MTEWLTVATKQNEYLMFHMPHLSLPEGGGKLNVLYYQIK